MKKILFILLIMLILDGCGDDLSPPEQINTPITNTSTNNYHSPNSDEPTDIDIMTDPSIEMLPLWISVQ